MESSQNPFSSSTQPGVAIGQLSNGGTRRYLIEAESSTGYIAWKLSDGTTLINQSPQVSLPADPLVTFWACASFTDSTPAGQIVKLDCHGNSLTKLNVHGLSGLNSLDCSFNNLAQFSVGHLSELQVLDASNNRLAEIDVQALRALRVLDCSMNRLNRLDVSGLASLQVLDYAGNPDIKVRADCCPMLEKMPGAQKKNGNAHND